MHGCNPTSSFFLEIEKVLPLAEAYNFFDKTLLGMECTLAKCTLANKEFEAINEVLLELVLLKPAFPSLVRLMQLAFTIVVSTAECEQSFSLLKQIKSYLHSTLSEDLSEKLGYTGY